MKKNMDCRGLGPDCFDMIGRDEGLQALLNHIKGDCACCPEVRCNYLSCYYRGGSMLKLEFNLRQKNLTFTFDPKYFDLKKTSKKPFTELEAWLKTKSKDPRQWLNRLEALKGIMDAWFEEHPKAERSVQQELAKSNTFSCGSCQTMDMELAIPGHRELGRMDLIVVCRKGERYIPLIVELKHGTKAFGNRSGLQAHYDKTTKFLREPGGEAYLVKTIRSIWDSKLRLGLIQEPVPGAGSFDEAELMFAVTGWEKGNVDKIRSKFPGQLERNVWVVTSHDQTLYFDDDRKMLFPKTGGEEQPTGELS